MHCSPLGTGKPLPTTHKPASCITSLQGGLGYPYEKDCRFRSHGSRKLQLHSKSRYKGVVARILPYRASFLAINCHEGCTIHRHARGNRLRRAVVCCRKTARDNCCRCQVRVHRSVVYRANRHVETPLMSSGLERGRLWAELFADTTVSL